jgi:elongation factor G
MRGDEVNSILSVSVHAASEELRDDLEQAVAAFIDRNPACKINVESREEKIVISGEDELELESVCKQLLESGSVEIGELKIGYRETVRKTAEAEGKYIRQTGGSGNYGHCRLSIEPNERGKGYEFINDIKGGVVPTEYIKPIDQGVRGALELGVLAGFPIVDVKVILYDGSHHEMDSNEMAFRFAGSIAFKEAVRKASPVLLEPVMAIEVTVPEEFIGTVIGDINSRRGRIENIERAAGSQVIKAIVPLAELLRLSARGRPGYALRFAGYEVARGVDGSVGDDAGVPARKPEGPRPKNDSATAGF